MDKVYLAHSGFQDQYLSHHGILGQKWGVRRYQNPDGSLTAEGKKHQKQLQSELENGKVSKETLKSELRSSGKKNWDKQLNKSIEEINSSEYSKRYQEAFARSAALDNEAASINASMGFPAVPMGRGAAEVALRQKELEDFSTRYLKEHEDDFASAALSDLGYNITDAGKNYLKKSGIMDWEV